MIWATSSTAPSWRSAVLATSANDGMVHIFKQSGGDKRGYNLKLSYIPGTMPRRILKQRLHPCQRAARLCRKRLCGRPLRRGRRLCLAPHYR
ncbi:PilC/PilY family type IV pilus protein [Neisseria meningitidis]|uniref:PilC/PilY family type IV pilus protein n=1 Tax=Neisseria meningitidis TaxID=487 RepID=UPI0038B80D60